MQTAEKEKNELDGWLPRIAWQIVDSKFKIY